MIWSITDFAFGLIFEELLFDVFRRQARQGRDWHYDHVAILEVRFSGH